MTRNRRVALFLVAGLLAGGVVGYLRLVNQPRKTYNYEATWKAPEGWKEAEMSGIAIFRYRHPSKDMYLRASVNQSVTPDAERLDADGMAQYQIDTTKQNQKEWTARRVDDIMTDALRFAAIRREQKGQAIVTAFAVKGDTALIVSLTASGEEASKLADEGMPDFKKLLASIRMKPTVVR